MAEYVDYMPDDTPEDQKWFWTVEWQAKEAEADADIKARRYTSYDSVEDFLKSLEEL